MDLSAQCRQSDFGDMVGISQPAVSDLLVRGVLTDGAAAGQWLREYCGHMREIAAGRLGNGDLDLVTERARLARVQRERIEMQNAMTRRTLLPATLLVEIVARAAPKACGILDSIVPALRRRSGYSAEDLNFITTEIVRARNAIASMKYDEVMSCHSGEDDGFEDVGFEDPA